MNDAARCPACRAGAMQVFHEQHAVPVNSCVLVPERTDALTFPTGRIRLAWCAGCGFVSNLDFDPALAEYSARYEETQAYSARFVSFARDLAHRWVDAYGLAGRSVLEIGCGKGEFLTLMVGAGVGRATGIDPGLAVDRIDPAVDGRVEWITDFYSERYARLSADAVVCRHTLEHIGPVADFMRMIRANIGDRLDTVVLFEVPDVQRVLDEVAFWDVYYEHCSYFTAGSLERLFRATGFDVLAVESVFDDQYLLIEARPEAGSKGPRPPGTGEDDIHTVRTGAARLAADYRRKIGEWQSTVAEVAERRGRTVVWGAGSKGVAFLTALGGNVIEYAVDVNPHKHGMYMAGTGQRIVPPTFMKEYRPDLVIAMNPIYRGEIKRDLDELGVEADLVAV
ncbi:MAG: class I SAM-dependent methyltransferase [Jiangellaceae bacterium]